MNPLSGIGGDVKYGRIFLCHLEVPKYLSILGCTVCTGEKRQNCRTVPREWWSEALCLDGDQ